MTIPHIPIDETKYRGKRIMDRVRLIRRELSGLEDECLAMAKIKDTDGDTAANFVKVAELYGVGGADQSAKNAAAKVLFDELNATAGPSSQACAALIQLMALLGA